MTDPTVLLDAHLAAPGRRAAAVPARRPAAGPLGHRAGLDARQPAGGCWSPATAAAPPRPSTSPPNWSASCATTAQPLSAIALHAETSALTAIGNDYGYDEVFARQVRAHGRPGDILLLLSTSGASPNLLAAAHAARDTGLRTLGAHRPGAQPARRRLPRDAAPCRPPDSQVVQELHLVASARALRVRRPGAAGCRVDRCGAGRSTCGPGRCAPASRWCSTAGRARSRGMSGEA